MENFRVWVLAVAPRHTESVQLAPGQEVRVGRGPGVQVRVEDATLAERALMLRALDDGRVEVHLLDGPAPSLNEVQLTGVSVARAGDCLQLGGTALLFQVESPRRKSVPRVVGYEDLEYALESECARGARFGRSFTLWVIRSGAFAQEGRAKLLGSPELAALGPLVLGEIAPSVLAVLLPETTPAQSETLRGRLAEALGRSGQPVQWGWAAFPQDGMEAPVVLGRALDRLLGDDAGPLGEPLRVDPVMERLYALVGKFSDAAGLVVLRGEASVGKQRFARVLHEHSARASGPFVVFAPGTFTEPRWNAALELAGQGTLYVPHAPGLPSPALQQLVALGGRAICSAPERFKVPSAVTVSIPALRDRPAEILPLAEMFLEHAAARLGRGPLALTTAAQELLAKDRWPGNLRELQNGMVRAALMAEGTEVRREQLPPRVLRENPKRVPEGGLRAALKETERETLEETLTKTSWNVSAAAKLLGLPRRTVVYRMTRLGLKRPSGRPRGQG